MLLELCPVVGDDAVGLEEDVLHHLVGVHGDEAAAGREPGGVHERLGRGRLADDELGLERRSLAVARRDDLDAQAVAVLFRDALGLGDINVAEVHGLDLGQRLVHGGDHRAADNARADKARGVRIGGGGILGHQAADGGGAHRGDERAVQNAERQHRLGVTQDGNVDAVGDARDRGVLLGLRRPLDAADVDVATDVARHGVEERLPVFLVRDAGVGLGRVLDEALTEHRVGLFRNGQDLFHIEKAGLDDIFLLKEQNFGIDRVKHFCFLQ